MATNITNQQIDNAIPNKGSNTPHAEQPNRKLTNGILKAIAAVTNALGTAATRDVTVDNADVIAGRLLKVGDLGSNKHTVAALDFNDLPELYPYSGLIPVMSKIGSINKPPKGDYYHVFQTIFSGGIINRNTTQIAIPYEVNREGFFIRNRYEGVWHAWREVIHTGNILATTGQSTLYPMTQKAVTDAINGISDERDKTEINEIDLGLEVIENINTFSFKLNKRDWYRQEAAKELVEVEEDGKVTIQEKINDDVLNAPLSDFEENDGSLKRDDVYTGFVAQDLKETLEALDLGHLGIVKNYAEEYEGGEDRFYIEHLALLPFLVNSIKQLSARVKELEDAAE